MPGPLKFPPDHRPGLEVPRGGSSCASCKYFKDDGVGHGGCGSRGFEIYYGTDRIPLPADRFCSDWFEVKRGALARADDVPPARELVGGIQGEPKIDVIVHEASGWHVYSEGKPRKHLGGPYPSRKGAAKRLQQVEYFKRTKDIASGYVPPPKQGTAHAHPGPSTDPAAEATGRPSKRTAAPDPNTPPMVRADARSRKRLPRQLPPTRIAEDYAKKLMKLVRGLRAHYEPLLRAIPAALARNDDVRADAVDLRKVLAEAGRAASKAISQPQVAKLAGALATQVGSFQKAQLSRQVKSAMGVDPTFKDARLKQHVGQFVRENVSLIKTIPEDLHDNVADLVQDAVQGARLAGGRGRNPDSLRKDIEERFGISERHARVIARDQTLKYYARLNHDRQQDLGVTRFVWQTVGDQRVRDEHAELDGETYEYDDPPIVDGEAILPGDGVQCRCWAEPVLDDLLEAPDDDGEDTDTEDDDEE